LTGQEKNEWMVRETKVKGRQEIKRALLQIQQARVPRKKPTDPTKNEHVHK
jgi:hypothetical protein